jgi:hypothetical protein
MELFVSKIVLGPTSGKIRGDLCKTYARAICIG